MTLNLFLIAALSYDPVVPFHPVLGDSCWSISPHVDHQVGGEIGHSVSPPPGEV